MFESTFPFILAVIMQRLLASGNQTEDRSTEEAEQGNCTDAVENEVHTMTVEAIGNVNNRTWFVLITSGASRVSILPETSPPGPWSPSALLLWVLLPDHSLVR